MSLGFLDLPEDGLDPVEASSRVARNITAAVNDLTDSGIVAYLSASDSNDEFDARLATKDCFAVVAAAAQKHLGGDTDTLVQHLRVVAFDEDSNKTLAIAPCRNCGSDKFSLKDTSTRFPGGTLSDGSYAMCDDCGFVKATFGDVPRNIQRSTNPLQVNKDAERSIRKQVNDEANTGVTGTALTCEGCGSNDFSMRYEPLPAFMSVWPVYTCKGCSKTLDPQRLVDSMKAPREAAMQFVGPYDIRDVDDDDDATGENVIDKVPFKPKNEKLPWNPFKKEVEDINQPYPHPYGEPKKIKNPWDDEPWPIKKEKEPFKPNPHGDGKEPWVPKEPFEKHPDCEICNPVKIAFNPAQDATDHQPIGCASCGTGTMNEYGVCDNGECTYARKPAEQTKTIDYKKKKLNPELVNHMKDLHGIDWTQNQPRTAADDGIPDMACEHCGGSGRAEDALSAAKNTIYDIESQLSDLHFNDSFYPDQESDEERGFRDGDFRMWADRLHTAYENLRHLPGSIGTGNPNCTGCDGTGQQAYRGGQ